MPRSHFIFDKELGRYFRTCPWCPIPFLPDAITKADADLYEREDATVIAASFYGVLTPANDKWELVEATAQEHAHWRCVKAARTKTDKRARAARRVGKLYGGRKPKRICRCCAEEMDQTLPKKIHTCAKCAGELTPENERHHE